jgi:hypothetical protein
MKKGWIYCLSNKCIPGLLKIGQTKNCPQLRAEKLQTTGVPLPFKLEIAKEVNNFEKKEKLIHSIFENFSRRINNKREFFEIDLKTVKTLFELIDGEYWTEENDSDIFYEIMKDGQKLRHVIDRNTFLEGNYLSEKKKILFEKEEYTPEEFYQVHCDRTKILNLKYSLSNYKLLIEQNWVPLIEILQFRL